MTPEKLLENLYAIAYSLPEQERRFFCALEPAIDPNTHGEISTRATKLALLIPRHPHRHGPAVQAGRQAPSPAPPPSAVCTGLPCPSRGGHPFPLRRGISGWHLPPRTSRTASPSCA